MGEIIGGSQRENWLDVLTRMDDIGLSRARIMSGIWSCGASVLEHAGFGTGFERLIMYLTGIPNIRDVLPFPRTAGGF